MKRLLIIFFVALGACGGGGDSDAPEPSDTGSDRAAELLAEWTLMTPAEQADLCETMDEQGVSAVADFLGVDDDPTALGVLEGLCH